MQTSLPGRRALAMREGKRFKAYRDSVGVWTIGIGHTSSAGQPTVTPNLVITDAECDAIFARDLAKYEATVNAAIKRSIGQNAFDACVSLCYNIGQGGFAGSTVVKRINAGDMPGAAEAFLMWSKPPEIMGRRRGERDQFIRPDGAPAKAAQPVSPPPLPTPATLPTIKPQHVAAVSGVALLIAGVVSGWDHVISFFTHLF